MQENQSSILRDRDFEEVEGGYYDHQGYYITPNGSFWDENLVYYNRDGFDKYGGTFDEYGTYIPGPDWNEDFGCYNVEMGNHSKTHQDALQNALQETIKEELLDEYHYYQNFFTAEEHPNNIYNLEIPKNVDVPLKEEYGYNLLGNSNKFDSFENNPNIPNIQITQMNQPMNQQMNQQMSQTPSKKVDTISLGKISKTPNY
jgi:hypothetical protein